MKILDRSLSKIGLAGIIASAALALFALATLTIKSVQNPNISSQLVVQAADNPGNDPVTAANPQPEIPAESRDEIPDSEFKVATAKPVKIELPESTPEEVERIAKAVAALQEAVATLDYQRAKYHPLHFPPQNETASNEECLVCHQEIMTYHPRTVSPAGIKADQVLAWYQTLDTYSGEQQSFHYRHLSSPLARQVMNLSCNFCHKGNDPREETPDMLPTREAFATPGIPEFNLRKMVNPSTTCLRCHGAMPDPENIMGVGGSWPEARGDFEDEETPNGCLTCHQDIFRTVRHQVTYLNPAAIEELARDSSDVCFGCHGGRQWYRISYPYPRHAWPDMDEEVPEWAVGRPTHSDPEYQLNSEQAAQ